MGNTGYISKDEFTKMLFNFPKEEITKFYDKIFGKAEGSQIIQPINRFQSEIGESIANFNIKIQQKTGDDEDTSINEIASRLDDEYNDIIKDEDDSKISLEHFAPKHGILVRKLSDHNDERSRKRKLSVVTQVRRRKVIPTNVGNQIIIWCDSIYENYGQGDKLYLPEFIEWAEIHKNVIFTFARYFRYSMWQSFNNELTNKEYLGFHKLTPVLQENFLIKFDTEKQFTKALGCLYIEFLFIWYDKTKSVPDKIKILKDVNIVFTDQEFKIEIQHYSSEYHNFAIKIGTKPVYLYWKEILTNYSR